MADRQRLQNDRIDQAENGGIGADSQREGKNRDGREAGARTERADRIAKILHAS